MRVREASRAKAAKRLLRTLIALCAAGLVAGCGASTMPEPPNWIPAGPQPHDDPYGSWAWVEFGDEGAPTNEGELVAVQDDSIYLFQGDSLRIIPAIKVTRVGVIRYRGATPIVERFWDGDNAKDRARNLSRLSEYARFPQGLPPGVDPQTLRPRP